MIDIWYSILSVLPFSWVQYGFMRNALLAVIFVSPCFGLIGTMVVGNRMAFFSDVIGHSALTGLAIGIILGFADPRPVMVLFAVMLAVAVNLLKRLTQAASDTVMGVLFAATIALGVALLSRGGFAKFTVFLVGDILTVTPAETSQLLIMLVGIILFWIYLANPMYLISIHPSLARSRSKNVFFIETVFSALVAVVVILSIRWVGILIINSLFILPAAASRIISKSIRAYTVWSVLISLVSGIAGLIISYYWGSACGATIVLCTAVVYGVIVLLKWMLHVRSRTQP